MREYNRYKGLKQLSVSVLAVILLLLLAVPARAAEGGNDTAPSGTLLSSLASVIDTYAADRRQTTAAVSVAVVNDGRIVFNQAYGFADIEHETAADTDTVFEWGSCSKLLVWTSVMQLVEQGKLDLQQDIREYLPEGFFKKLKVNKPITLLNLMHHNAGWQDRATDLFYFAEEDLPELGEALALFEPRQVYEPGKVVAYSNYGAALAAYLVELQSGQSFYIYVKEHIFDVLGMEHTSIHPAQRDNEAVDAARNKIQGYTTKLKLIKKNRGYIGIYPAGSAIGTAGDAAKFLAALMPAAGDYTPLFQSNTVLREMLSPSLNYDGTDIPRIAHGFFEVNHTVPALEHGGNTLGFSSKFTIDPASGFGMVVMTNQYNEWEYCAGLTDKVFGTYKPQASSVDLPDSVQVEGEYQSARRVVHGFTKLLGYLSTMKIVSINRNVIDFNDMPYKQIEPYVYVPVRQSGFAYFVRDAQGAVVKVSNPYFDSFPLTGLAAQRTGISVIAAGLGALLIMFAMISGFVRWIISRFRRAAKPSSGFNQYYLWMNIAGLAFIVNNIILGYRTLNYTTYSAIRIHLIGNIVYVVLAAGYIMLLLMKLRSTEAGKASKIIYILSGVPALLFSAVIIGWDLFY
ncbi:serine hydrolase domain-containing protein [Paenibacillus pedocola]|uniref:serine hydrolase domain-containing protein n=1 Tax=Paenibacillus pedocola TaxID=3242193 RepID=UPI002877643F|nr:serine hydrolase domain-containing protein [Paenibacillus typhae]